MDDPDESISLGDDVSIDGRCDGEIVRSIDAAEVQQVVLDVDGKMPFKVWDVHLDVRWGVLPPLGKVPEDV